MESVWRSFIAVLLSWWGVGLIAALDCTIIFFMPLAVDIAVIVLASQSPAKFWVYPFLASAGSVCGAAVTYYMGRRLGEVGLKRLISTKRLAKIQRRIEKKGAIPIAALDLIPPPFPFTAFILAAGAMRVSTSRFFIALGLFRLVRFGAEASLAFFYGRQIIGAFNSDVFEYATISLFVIAAAGTTVAVVRLIQSSWTVPDSF
jgi:membrane protein YqaA with SNARE-associated domain